MAHIKCAYGDKQLIRLHTTWCGGLGGHFVTTGARGTHDKWACVVSDSQKVVVTWTRAWLAALSRERLLEVQGRKTSVCVQCTALDGKHVVMKEHGEQYINCDSCEAMGFIGYKAGVSVRSSSDIIHSTHPILHPSSPEAWRGGLTIVNKSLLGWPLWHRGQGTCPSIEWPLVNEP